MRFCPRCATPLEERIFDGIARPTCPHCDYIYYRDPKVAVAVLVAILGGGMIDRVNLLAIAFVVARVLYTICYLADWAALRSLMWFTGVGLCVALFVQPAFAH